MPAVIYARVSPRPDSGDDSIKTQVDQCEQWCLDNGIDIRSRHHEQDVSGASEDRPGLWEAIDELRAGDTLVVYRLDRIARDVYLAESFHRQIAKKGAHVHAVQSGAVDDTPEGRMIRQILDVASEYERRVIGKRTSTAMQNHQRSGRLMSRHAVYGWMVDPDDPKRTVKNPDEQRAIKAIVKMRSVGMGYRQIAKQCEDLGFPRRGEFWHTSTVRKICQRHGSTAKRPPSSVQPST